MRRFIALSIALHAVLTLLGPRASMPIESEELPPTSLEIAFELAPEPLKEPAAAEGLDVDGIEPERTTGRASGPDRGRAGDAFRGGAIGAHREGDDPRDRFAAGAEQARALTAWVAEGIDASPTGRSPYDATSALGARDDASLGARGDSRVAIGERGLDMVGTGHGSCPPGEECAAGSTGGLVVGPGSLGGRAPSSLGSLATRVRAHGRCITHLPCPRARRGLAMRVVVHGAIAQSDARRVMTRHRNAIGGCLARARVAHGSLELFVAPDGHVASVTTTDLCLEAEGRAVTFPSATGPSIVIVHATLDWPF